MSRLRRWWALPRDERRSFLALWCLMPVMSGSLRWLGYRKTLAWVERTRRNPRRHEAPTFAQADRLAQLASIAGRHAAVEATCLRQALAVMWLLRRHGVSPTMQLGVDRKGKTPDMHAWLELDARPLGQSELRHQPFQR